MWQQNEREIDLPPAVVDALSALPYRDGAVFRPDKRSERAAKPGEWQGYADSGRAYGGQAKKAWATACRRAGLPGASGPARRAGDCGSGSRR